MRGCCDLGCQNCSSSKLLSWELLLREMLRVMLRVMLRELFLELLVWVRVEWLVVGGVFQSMNYSFNQ